MTNEPIYPVIARKLSGVHISGFRGFPFRSFDQYYDTDADCVLLLGANGFGKTSFIEAIAFAFTGTTLRDPKSIPHRAADTQEAPMVRCEFYDQNKVKHELRARWDRAEPQLIESGGFAWTDNIRYRPSAHQCLALFSDLVDQLFDEDATGSFVDLLAPLPADVDRMTKHQGTLAKLFAPLREEFQKRTSQMTETELLSKIRQYGQDFANNLRAWEVYYQPGSMLTSSVPFVEIPRDDFFPDQWFSKIEIYLLLAGTYKMTDLSDTESRRRDEIALSRSEKRVRILEFLRANLMEQAASFAESTNRSPSEIHQNESEITQQLRDWVQRFPASLLLEKWDDARIAHEFKALEEKEKILTEKRELLRKFWRSMGESESTEETFTRTLNTLTGQLHRLLPALDQPPEALLPPSSLLHSLHDLHRLLVSPANSELAESPAALLGLWQGWTDQVRESMLHCDRELLDLQSRKNMCDYFIRFQKFLDQNQHSKTIRRWRNKRDNCVGEPNQALADIPELTGVLSDDTSRATADRALETALQELTSWSVVELIFQDEWLKRDKDDLARKKLEVVDQALNQFKGTKNPLRAYQSERIDQFINPLNLYIASVLQRFRASDTVRTAKIKKTARDKKITWEIVVGKTSAEERPFSSLSVGERHQVSTAFMLGMNMLMQEILHTRFLLIDDVMTSFDTAQIGRMAVLLRQIAYGSEDSPTTRQVILASHHDDMSNRLLDFLRPPPGRTLKILRFNGPNAQQMPQITVVEGKPYQNSLEQVKATFMANLFRDYKFLLNTK
jgi:DNA repair exonuclease SbcCD ATPase subunit